MKSFKLYLSEGRPSQRHPLDEEKSTWKGHSDTVKNPNFNDELSNRRVNPVGNRLKSGKLSANERGSQERIKTLMKHTQKKGGLTGPKGLLPEEQGVAKAGVVETDVFGVKAYHSKCLEPGCKFESKRFSTMKKAQEAAKKHAEKKHFVKEEVEELDEAIPKSTHYATVHSSSRKIVAKGNKKEMMKKMKELNNKEKGSHIGTCFDRLNCIAHLSNATITIQRP